MSKQLVNLKPVRRVEETSLRFTTYSYIPNGEGGIIPVVAICSSETLWYLGNEYGHTIGISDYEIKPYIKLFKAARKIKKNKTLKYNRQPKSNVIRRVKETIILTTDASWRESINPDGLQYNRLEAVQFDGGWLIGTTSNFLKVQQFEIDAYIKLLRAMEVQQRQFDR